MDAAELDYTGIATIIGAIGAAIAVVLGAYAKFKRELAEIKTQVSTVNGKTLARIVEEAESRRISRIPEHNRTEEECKHLEVIPPPERPGRDASINGVVDTPVPGQ